MAVDVLLGLQWGDEGKGKIVDYLAKKYDVVARFQGGPNAGHTLEFDGIKHVLHQIPSGVFHPHIMNIIGNGVILNPVVFKQEAQNLTKYNIDLTKNLYISKKAQIILPTHLLLDQAYEKAKGDKKIGSTLKGIGPTYQDKIGRQGLRVGDILLPDFKERYEKLKAAHLNILERTGAEIDTQVDDAAFFEAIEYFKKFHLVESEYFLYEQIQKGKSVLAEGAQGAMLDIDFGTYPYVTSSNTVVAGACTGLGLAPRSIDRVLGIFKAYCTRVGGGPFPTELFDDEGARIGKIGNEFGSTTGRARRCGWIDLPALKYAIMLSGVTELMMMKTDVLNSFKTIKVCTAYKLVNGEVTTQVPHDLSQVEAPVYEELQGWDEEITGKTYEELPENLVAYIDYLEKQLNTPISIISMGPDRTQTIQKSIELV